MTQNNQLIDFTRWLLKKVGLGIAGLIGLIIIVLIFVTLSDEWENRPRLITELHGISPGDKLSDVVFKHGDFQPPPSDQMPKDISAGETLLLNSDKSMAIHVRDKKVSIVAYYCKASDYLSVNGISCRDSGDRIIDKFGDKVRVLCAKAEPSETPSDEMAKFTRVYDVVEYGVRYLLFNNSVYGFTIANKKNLQSYVGINWDKCE